MKKQYLIIGLLLFIVSCKETNEQLFQRAQNYYKAEQYQKAINGYTQLIKRSNKLQAPYFNRGFCFLKIKNYQKALDDFNKVMSLNKIGNFIFTLNEQSPVASEEGKFQISYYDALYQRALVKFDMDSLTSSFQDFEILIKNNYPEKSNCLLWEGTLLLKAAKKDKACEYFSNAKQIASNEEDRKEAEKMIKSYCEKSNK